MEAEGKRVKRLQVRVTNISFVRTRFKVSKVTELQRSVQFSSRS